MSFNEIGGNMFSKEAFILLGDVLIATTVQYVLANLEMTSRFNIIHFANEQDILQHAADDLVNYIKISIMCCIGLVLLYFVKYGGVAAILCLITNILVVTSIYSSYILALEQSMKRNNLQYPNIKFL
jgi:hypothetical protein